MFSKRHRKGDVPVALDDEDNHVVYYHHGKYNPEPFESVKGFTPWHHGDKVCYICARRGAGKSTFCNIYMENYVEATDGRVFFISRFEDDPSIKLPERSMRLSVGDLPQVPLEELTNSLLVFDDIHSSQYTRQESNYIQSFILDAIQNSRHFNISILITSHMISNYAKTRDILNEMSSLVVFPAYSNAYQIERALKTYVGLNKEQIDDIMSISDSRWVMIQTISPKFVLTQHKIYPYK